MQTKYYVVLGTKFRAVSTLGEYYQLRYIPTAVSRGVA